MTISHYQQSSHHFLAATTSSHFLLLPHHSQKKTSPLQRESRPLGSKFWKFWTSPLIFFSFSWQQLSPLSLLSLLSSASARPVLFPWHISIKSTLSITFLETLCFAGWCFILQWNLFPLYFFLKIGYLWKGKMLMMYEIKQETFKVDNFYSNCLLCQLGL